MRHKVIGVMGGADADEKTCRSAFRLGELVAGAGYVLLTGGRPFGVMEHASRGARSQGGLTVGILPGRSGAEASSSVDLVIASGMGDARNVINVLSSDVVIACPGSVGTLSEVALALKNGKRVIAIGFQPGPLFDRYRERGLLSIADSPEAAFEQAVAYLDEAASPPTVAV